jgi:signal transduction histidine kinase/ActR/RegA family two-component response regulator
MRRRFDRLPIHRKLAVVALLIVGAALTVAFIGLIGLDLWRVRSAATSDIRSLSQILAENLAAAVVFEEHTAALATLETMRVRSQVRQACVYADDATLFAEYSRDPETACPATLGQDERWTAITVQEPIRAADRVVGTLVVERDLSDLGSRITMAAAIGLVMLLVAAAVALALAHRLYPVISAPITELASVARRLGTDDNYDVPDIRVRPDEIGELVSAFRAMAARVKAASEERERLLVREREANRLKDQFLAAVSHELRTPLNAIVGWTHVLMTAPAAPPLLERALSSIDRNAQAQARVIEDLLDISRIATGRFSLASAAVDLRVVLENATETLKPLARAKDITLTVRAEPPGSCVVYGDAGRLQQAIWNLLSNAIKFTPPHGKVEVSLGASEHGCHVAVTDTGIGIAADFLPHVFERFRQHDGSMARERGGLGLGLAIVKELVELHGGAVVAESAGLGKGACFTVQLPRHLGPFDSSEAFAGSTAVELATSPALAGVRVLVVDDNDDALGVASTALESAGASVMTARSGDEAIAIWRAGAGDVLLSDLAMPRMDGFELLRHIREIDRIAGRLTPAIAVTAHASQAQQDQSIRAGFQQHLSKPLTPDAIVSSVVAVLERS